MPSWKDTDAATQSSVLAKAAAAYAKFPQLSGQGPSVKGEFVFNLNAQDSDLNDHLVLAAKLNVSDKGMTDEVTRELKAAVEGVDDAQVSIQCSHQIGSVAKSIENLTNFEGKTVNFTHNGEVVLLDFWATWCPPCQAPMAHNQEMMVKNKDKWGKNVRIVGLSIDDSLDKLKNHVNTKGWGDVEHYHARNGKNTADKEFGVRGVPHCLLLDKEGKIVFIGHPASRNLEQDINDLLEGKTISGKGCEAATGGAAAGGMNSEKYAQVKSFFLEETARVMKLDDVKTASQKCMRAFLVMTSEGTWDSTSSSVSYTADFHNVLMGPKASIDTINTQAQALNDKDGDYWKMNKGHRATD